MNDTPANPIQDSMFQAIVRDMSRDMKFVGALGIVFGALYCLTIIGALLGVPYIIASMRLREAADSFLGYLDSNDFSALRTGFERQKRFFFIVKVLLIIGLVAGVAYLFVVFAMIATGTYDALSTYY